MAHRNRFPALALAALIGIGIPGAASAATQATGSYSFRTALTNADGRRAGAYEGVLTIEIASSGTVQGIYREEDTGRIIDVTGGLTGTRLWLDLGNRHVDGTLVDGKIDGYTPIGTAVGPGGVDDGYHFVAVPSEQHI